MSHRKEFYCASEKRTSLSIPGSGDNGSIKGSSAVTEDSSFIAFALSGEGIVYAMIRGGDKLDIELMLME